MTKTIKYIDLFSGIGGFRLGLDSIGMECVFSSEIDVHARKTYFENFREYPSGDLSKISSNDVPDHDILCAGFPCQPFSISGNKRGFEDTRGTLFFEICRILEGKKPRVVFLENVKHLIHHDGGNTFSVIIDKLNELGYTTSYMVLNSKDFGVPQNRERVIIIGVLGGFFDFSLVETIDKEHIIEDILETGVDAPDMEYLSPDEYTLIPEPKKQKKSGLMFAGYRNKNLRITGVRPNTEHLSRAHKQPNRIYSVKGTHPTIPSQESSGRFFVLLTDNRVRKLTLLECFRLMGFPDEFRKVSPVGEQYKQIGNSICVPMVSIVGEAIKRQIFS